MFVTLLLITLVGGSWQQQVVYEYQTTAPIIYQGQGPVVYQPGTVRYQQEPGTYQQVVYQPGPVVYQPGQVVYQPGQTTITITYLDAQTVPPLIQYLVSLQPTTTPQNQYYIQLLITELQRELGTGQFNQNLVPLIVQFIDQIRAYPTVDASNSQLVIYLRQTQSGVIVTQPKETVEVEPEKKNVGLLAKLNNKLLHPVERGANALLDNTLGKLAESNIPGVKQAGQLELFKNKLLLNTAGGGVDMLVGGKKDDRGGKGLFGI